MADSRVIDCMYEQGQFESARANFNQFWQSVSDRVDPNSGYFLVYRAPGQQRSEKQFDATATIALGRATAAFESLFTPRTQKWQDLTASGPLSDDLEVKRYLESFRDLLFRVRYSARANFANNNSEFIRSFLNYGNGVMYVDDDPGKSLRYKHIALHESYFGEDHVGKVDRFHRKFVLTARQLVQKFPKANLSQNILQAAEKTPNREFDLIHRVCANLEIDPKRRDYAGKKFMGYYVLTSEEQVLDMAGFDTMPYIVARYRVNAKEVYGRGPVMDILPTIKTVNEQQKTNLRIGQRLADPPLLASQDGAASQFNLRGGFVNYGALDAQGRPLVRPLEVTANLPVSLEMQESERGVIRDSLFIEIFNILKENPQMTATQTLQLVQERGVLMGPAGGNLQSSGYGALTEREIDLMSQIGGGMWLESQIGPMPPALLEAGGAYEIQYDAPINRAQKAEEGIAISQTLESAAAVAQFDPNALKPFKIPEMMRGLAEVRGLPSKYLKTEAEVQAENDQQQQQQELAELLAAAPILGSTAKDLSQAQASAGTSPGYLPA